MHWWRQPSSKLYKGDILILKMSSHSAMYSYVEDGELYHGGGMIKILQAFSKENINILLHLGHWFSLAISEHSSMVVYREMTGSGGMNSGPYRKHVKWGQCTYKNPIRAKQENMITCNQYTTHIMQIHTFSHPVHRHVMMATSNVKINVQISTLHFMVC